MITVKYDNIDKLQEKIWLEITPDLFDQARKIYREIPSYRHDPILVKKAGQRAACLVWKDNNITVSRRKNQYRIATCEDYWDYTIEDAHMDLRLLEDADAYVFDEMEEYSMTLVQIIRKHWPERKIWFLDPNAKLFLEHDPEILCAASVEEITQELTSACADKEGSPDAGSSSCKSVRLMRIGGEGSGSITKEKIRNREYASLQVMHSIYWMSKEVSFGDRNPDRRIALIKSPLAFEGLAGTLRYVLTRAESIARSGFDAALVVDLGILGDENQFCGGSGQNVWDLYFEPLSDVSVSEAYQSRHVYLANDAMKTSDPWLWIQDADSDFTKLIPKYLRFNEKTQAFLEKQYQTIIPSHQGKILGIVGRGSDYNITLPKGYKGDLMRPLSPEEILEKTVRLLKEQGYEYAFLATEDAVVFDLFMNSGIKDRILYVPQERIDYSKTDGTEYLADLYKEMEERDGYQENLRYLGILNILSKCDALIATTLCGAVKIASGLNGGSYEYMDVPGTREE